MKKTKIICSIGPASCEADVMEQMVLAGMNIARFNFSHMTDDERNKNIASVKEVRKRTGANVAILWDTKGPEFRSGVLEGETIELVEGNTIRLVKEDVKGNQERITVNHPEALDSLEVGNEVLLENAKMKIEVISKEEDGVTCKIVNGGLLGNRKSLSVPGVKLNIPYLSEADVEDIKIACQNGGEYIAASFVSCKEDVLAIRGLCHENGRDDFLIISKIESDLGIKMSGSGNLTSWAEQGVLLLNNVLTVKAHEANSHKKKGWEYVTDKIVEKLNEREETVIFVFWGNNAKSKQKIIDTTKNIVLTAPHPSPLSAYHGFFGCGHFSKINEILRNSGKKEIDWQI